MYNALRMADAILDASPALRARAAGRYAALARRLAEAIDSKFLGPEGVYRGDLLVFADGAREWVDFPQADYWEYAWAVSSGPFLPNLPAAVRSARMAARMWPGIRDYGYCPWNTLSRFLKEYGLPSEAYRKMLSDEVREALLETPKYPMRGALTEYYKWTDGWRGLPFSAGTFILSAAACLLQPLPMGLAVRASDLVDRIDNFHWRSARIDAAAGGRGDVVAAASINGRPLVGTLQVPETALRMGRNRIEVTRGQSFGGVRLYGSTAALITAEATKDRLTWHFASPADAQVVVEGFDRTKRIRALDAAGKAVEFRAEPLPDTGLTVLSLAAAGDFTVTVDLA
jgi:hypothetical protein